jgi:hypothetical protein
MNKITDQQENILDSKIDEALIILQEECAEVIVEVSKIRRFGIDSLYLKPGFEHGVTHRQRLVAELGDVTAMIDILVEQGVITRESILAAAENKKFKLREFSSIYE